MDSCSILYKKFEYSSFTFEQYTYWCYAASSTSAAGSRRFVGTVGGESGEILPYFVPYSNALLANYQTPDNFVESFFAPEVQQMPQNSLIGIAGTPVSVVGDQEHKEQEAQAQEPAQESASIALQDYRPFMCVQCGKRFRWNHQITKHLKKHDKKRPACDQCSATFKWPYELKNHKKTHTLSLLLEKTKCPFPGCVKKFSKPGSFNFHLKVHEQEGAVCPTLAAGV